jgi:hypothetical protein
LRFWAKKMPLVSARAMAEGLYLKRVESYSARCSTESAMKNQM